MLIKEQYTILDELTSNDTIYTELCILNFNIMPVLEQTKTILLNNPNVTFWLATKDFSKEYILTANKLGIKNIIPQPIKTELIKDFFKTKEGTKQIIESSQNYLPLKNSKILIVDDNELNIKLLTEVLQDLEIEIHTSQNPKNCIDKIKNEKFDLFLLDILMPEMSGFELAEQIKKTKANSITPIIFISAVSGTENILNGYNIGAYSYIEKPFHPNIVKSQIYNLLKSEEDKKLIEKEKEHFVATLTHDLKSPINAEINALKYLLKNSSNDMKNIQGEILNELLNSANYMKLITDKILCHYKQKNEDIELKKEFTSFKNIIIRAIEELKYLAHEKNIKICFYTDTENDETFIDELEIKRVINNLLANAIEYSNKNGVIDIILKKTKSEFVCTIQDYGIGIDLSSNENIFDEYISLAKEHKKTGFGLGLNICKKIIEQHNGHISLTSKVGLGTTIEFSIPY